MHCVMRNVQSLLPTSYSAVKIMVNSETFNSMDETFLVRNSILASRSEIIFSSLGRDILGDGVSVSVSVSCIGLMVNVICLLFNVKKKKLYVGKKQQRESLIGIS